MFCQNCVTCPSICTDPGIPPPGIRTHTGAGDTVWQPILNLYNNVPSAYSGWDVGDMIDRTDPHKMSSGYDIPPSLRAFHRRHNKSNSTTKLSGSYMRHQASINGMYRITTKICHPPTNPTNKAIKLSGNNDKSLSFA